MKLLFFLILSFNVQADCLQFKQLAKESMKNRQEGVKITHNPKNIMENEMLLNVFQWPQYFTKDFKEKAIDKFSDNWYYACKHNIYGNYK